MPDADTDQEMQALGYRRARATADLVKVARAILPTLKDHNLNHTAAALEEKLFLLDAIDQEMLNVFKADPTGAIKAVLKRIERQGR